MVSLLDKYMDMSIVPDEHKSALSDQRYMCETESECDEIEENYIEEQNANLDYLEDDGSQTLSECSRDDIILGENDLFSFDTDDEFDVEFGTAVWNGTEFENLGLRIN